MSEKQRSPFKSGIDDFDELYKRVRELGVRPIVGDKNGVDVTPPVESNAPVQSPGHYPGY